MDELELRERELATRMAELDQSRRRLAAEQQAWATSRDSAERDLTARLEQMQARLARLESEGQQPNAEAPEGNTDARNSAARSGGVRRDRNQPMIEQELLAQQHAAFVAEHGASHAFGAESTASDVAENDEDSTDEQSPTIGGEDVFARLRRLSLLKDAANEAEPAIIPEPAPEPLHVAEPPHKPEPQRFAEPPRVAEPQRFAEPQRTAEPPRRRPAPKPAAPATDEEESIEAYMARLLNRMRGGADEPAKPAATPAPEPVAIVEPEYEEPAFEEPSLTDADVAADAEVEPLPPKPAEMIPRSAPGASCDLAAMRALANMQVHSALSAHRTSFRRRKTQGKWLTTGIAASVSTGLTWWALSADDVIAYTAGAAWVVTVLCCCQALHLTSQWFGDRKAVARAIGGQPEPEQAV